MPITFAGVPLTLATPEAQAVVDSLFSARDLWPYPPSAVRTLQAGLPVTTDWDFPTTQLGLLRWPVSIFPGFGSYLAVVSDATWQAIRTAYAEAYEADGYWTEENGEETDYLPPGFAPLKLTETNAAGAVVNSVTAYMGLINAFRLTKLNTPARLLVFGDIRYGLGNFLQAGAAAYTSETVGTATRLNPRISWRTLLEDALAKPFSVRYGTLIDWTNVPTDEFPFTITNAGSIDNQVGIPDFRWITFYGEPAAATESAGRAFRCRTVLTPRSRLSFKSNEDLRAYTPSAISNSLVGRPGNTSSGTSNNFETLSTGGNYVQSFPWIASAGNLQTGGLVQGTPPYQYPEVFYHTRETGHFRQCDGAYAGLISDPPYPALREVQWLYDGSTCLTNLLSASARD